MDFYLSGIDEISGETDSAPFLGEDLGFLPMLASSLIPSLLSRAAPLLLRSGMLSRAASVLSKVSPVAKILTKTRVPRNMFARAAQALSKGGNIPAVAQAAFAQAPEEATIEADQIRQLNPGNPYAQSLAQIRQEVSGMDQSELLGYLEGSAALAGFGVLPPAAVSVAERLARTVSNIGAKAAPLAKTIAKSPLTKLIPGLNVLATAYNVGSAGVDAYNRFFANKSGPSPTPTLPPAQTRPLVTAPNTPSWADYRPEQTGSAPVSQSVLSSGSALAMLDELAKQQSIRPVYPRRRSRRRRASVRTVVVQQSAPRTYRTSRKTVRTYRRKRRSW